MNRSDTERQSSDAASRSARAVGVVGLAVLSSRILGLVREQVFAGLFGAGRSLDAFLIAFRTPNLLRDLFAEGALSTAFVTVFSRKIEKEGDGAAWRLANKIATLTAVAMSLICLAGIALAPWIIALLAPGFDAEKTRLTVMLARIMYPFILLVSLAALAMGVLNARHIFGMPAMASTFFNLGSILAGAGLGYWFDPAFGTRSLIGLALGTLVGGLLQLVVQFPALRKSGFRFRPDFMWKDDGVREVLAQMGPAVIAASAVQVNVMINGMFASFLADGAVSWLQIAFRLMQLPLGMFGVAIGTVTLPMVSRSVARGDLGEFRTTLARGMRMAFVLTIPSAIGLVLLAHPIIGLLYERGRFTADATAQTAGALQFYAVGLVAYSALKVLTPAFYALGRRTTPMMVSFFSIGVNLALNALFTFGLGWGHRGLALSTGLVAAVNFVVLYAIMRRQLGRLETGRMAGSTWRLLLAGGALAAVCWAGQATLLSGWAQLGTLARAGALGATIAVAAAAFFGAAWLLRVREVGEAVDMIARRLRRRG